jgi:LysM repeat protein
MTDDVNPEVAPVDRVRRLGGTESPGYGKGAFLAGGVVAVVLIAALFMGGVGAINAMSNPPAAAANSSATQDPTRSPNADGTHTQAPPTSKPGSEKPGSIDPVTPPDRGSDQNEGSSQEDEIYYIQDGDTLTALSAQFGMSIDYIADYNAVRDVNIISEGAVLRVPFIYLPPAGTESLVG